MLIFLYNQMISIKNKQNKLQDMKIDEYYLLMWIFKWITIRVSAEYE